MVRCVDDRFLKWELFLEGETLLFEGLDAGWRSALLGKGIHKYEPILD